MSDENQNEKEEEHTLWEYGRAVSTLESSPSDLSEVRKKMIRYALDYPIHDIRTYAGYKGDLLVEITMKDRELLPVLQSYAQSIGMDTAIKMKNDIQIHELYCITPDEDIYDIKLPE